MPGRIEMGENGSATVAAFGAHAPLELTLYVTDAEVCAALEEHDEGRARQEFAATALKIGVLALRNVQGQVDTERLRNEGEHLLEKLASELRRHQESVVADVTKGLAEYLDPESGRFSERLERLIRKDGELAQVLQSQVGEDGELAKTLLEHVGEGSNLMALIDPESSEGLVEALGGAVEESVENQRELLLAEFSLDNKKGALARFIEELEARHGKVSEALGERIDEVVGEFSLDREDSALSRLVGRVEKAQRQISGEFSLDDDGSALARLKGELLQILEDQEEGNRHFQEQVIERLAEMSARKSEAARSTRHGDAFEAALFEVVEERSRRAGDVATSVGTRTGKIRNCKKGDITIELGREHVAAGTKIVIEAKANASQGLESALAELEKARKNRGADVGVFVYSAGAAPEGLERFARYGDDVVLVWDAEDVTTDVVLDAGLSVARAICVRAACGAEVSDVDLDVLEKAILAIEKQTSGLDEIETSAETIKNGSRKILDRVRIMRKGLAKETAVLDESVEVLRSVLGEV